MKKLLLLLLFILLLPITIHAKYFLTYNHSMGYVNEYIKDFDSYDAYLINDNPGYFCNIVSEKLLCTNKSGFTTGGYLNLAEFQLAGGRESYFYDGGDSYTMSDYDSNNVYAITNINDSSNAYKTVNKNSPGAGIKITQYIEDYMTVKGRGTYLDPWVFDIPEEWTYDPDLSFTVVNRSSITGDGGWFTQPANVRITTALPAPAIKTYKYCVSNNGECDAKTSGTSIFNASSMDTGVNYESSKNQVCAYIETIIGKTISDCSTVYKIDTVAPTCKVSTEGKNFIISNVVETTSQLADQPYSWASNLDGFNTISTKAAGDASVYNAWVKDQAGNVGSCSKMTCTAWSSASTKNLSASATCTNGISPTEKITNCSTILTCSVAAGYACGNGGTGSPSASNPYCYSATASKTDKVFTGYSYHGNIGRVSTGKKGGCTGSNVCYSRANCSGYSGCGTYCVSFCRNNTPMVNRCTCTRSENYSTTTTYYCTSGEKISNSQCRFTATRTCTSGYTNSSNVCYKYNQTSCASGNTSTVSAKTYTQNTRTCTSN